MRTTFIEETESRSATRVVALAFCVYNDDTQSVQSGDTENQAHKAPQHFGSSRRTTESQLASLSSGTILTQAEQLRMSRDDSCVQRDRD